MEPTYTQEMFSNEGKINPCYIQALRMGEGKMFSLVGIKQPETFSFKIPPLLSVRLSEETAAK